MIVFTPLRISLVGGGTDFISSILQQPGKTIAFTFNSYSIVTTRNLFEVSQNHKDLIKAALTKWNVTNNIKLTATCSIPPGSGLGTSSSLCVGLSVLLSPTYKLEDKFDIAINAIDLEKNYANIIGGLQDQLIAAFCGIQKFNYYRVEDYKGEELTKRLVINNQEFVITNQTLKLNPEQITEFNSHFILIDTGISRRSENILRKQIQDTKTNENSLRSLTNLVDEFWVAINEFNFPRMGELLKESWNKKKLLNKGITTKLVEDIILSLKNIKNIYGYKLLGAGGGGYILIICKNRDRLKYDLASMGHRIVTPKLVNQIDIEI